MAKKKKLKWFWVAVISALLAAPNATVIKFGSDFVSPLAYNGFRFFIVGIILLPSVIKARQHLTRSNVKFVVLYGIFMAISTICYVTATSISQASYTSILTLLTPISFVVLSRRIIGESINAKMLTGITLAALGAFIVVFMPIAAKQNAEIVFYPLATVLVFINVICFPLALIYARKAHESSVPLFASLGVGAWIICVSNVALMYIFNDINSIVFSKETVLAILYSGLIVAVVARFLSIVSYEHIGAAVSGSLMYLEALIAILLPVIILNERLSVFMVLGGVIILCGVFIAELHSVAHRKHQHLFRHH